MSARRAPAPLARAVATAARTGLALVLAASAADAADVAAAAEGRSTTRARLELRVNGSKRGDALVVLEAGGDVWVAAEDLAAAGLAGFAGRRSRLGERDHVALRSLAPALAFAIDDRALTLDLTAGPELLGRDRIDLGWTRPAGVLDAGTPSAYLNYAARAGADEKPSFAAEVGAGAGPLLVTSGVSAASGAAFVRGLSTLTAEEPDALRRWVGGDAAVSLGGLGSSAVVGGVGVARDFSLDPYFVQASRPATTAFASSPSTLEVYVNGALVRRQEVAPGTLDLANAPLIAGTNAVRTVLRDAYGREQVFDLRSVFSLGLLTPGLSDYAYHLGFLREDLARDSFGYGRPVALAHHRVGLTEQLTGGARVEAGLDRASFGPSLAFGSAAGEVDAELAGSVERGRPGGAGSLSWSWNDRRLNASARVRLQSRQYSSAALDLAADRALVDGSAFVGLRPADRLGLGLEVTGARARDAGGVGALTARLDVRLGAGLALFVSSSMERRGGATGLTGQALLSWTIGGRATAQLSGRGGAGGAGAAIAAYQPLPLGPGYGYRVEAAAGASEARGVADVSWQSEKGRYEVDLEQLGAQRTASLSAAGAAVLIGGRAFLSRPVDAGFGLVRVGLPDVGAYLENQEVGHTDGRGDLLVTSLQPRYANRLKIRAADVSMDYEVGKVEQLVAPPFKRGVVARFEVKPIRAATGVVEVQRDGRIEPAARGELVVRSGGGDIVAPTTSDGRFFLEHLTPGSHTFEVAWRHGACRLVVDVPDRPGIQDLGALRCAPEATASLAP